MRIDHRYCTICPFKHFGSNVDYITTGKNMVTFKDVVPSMTTLRSAAFEITWVFFTS